MTYREQEYVDRCYCDAPAVAHCAMCNRPRCAAHVEKDWHCHRCDEAIGYEMDGRRFARQVWSALAGFGGFLGALIAHSAIAIIPAAATAAGAVYGSTYLVQKQRARRALAPKLAATVGEVKPARDTSVEQGNHPSYKAPWVP